jgi:hypothetical protein
MIFDCRRWLIMPMIETLMALSSEMASGRDGVVGEAVEKGLARGKGGAVVLGRVHAAAEHVAQMPLQRVPAGEAGIAREGDRLLHDLDGVARHGPLDEAEGLRVEIARIAEGALAPALEQGIGRPAALPGAGPWPPESGAARPGDGRDWRVRGS